MTNQFEWTVVALLALSTYGVFRIVGLLGALLGQVRTFREHVMDESLERLMEKPAHLD